MENITDVKFGPLENSIYLKPFKFHYKQDGKQKFWDLIDIHDSVSILIYNVTKKTLVFVKQFRPAVYCKSISEKERSQPICPSKYPGSLGITLELCSGIVDKNKSLIEIAKEEVLEECGYDVPLENLQQMFQYRANVGEACSVLTMFYCEVEDSMKTSSGGGIDDEMIDIVDMTVEETSKYINSGQVLQCPGSLMLAYHWFLLNKNCHV